MQKWLLIPLVMLLYPYAATAAWAEDEISIEGRLLMLDDLLTPHVAVPVQAIRSEKVIATMLSNRRGEYWFINLKPGWYQVRCQVLGGYIYYGEEKEKPESQKTGKPKSGIMPGKPISPSAYKPISLQVEPGKTLKDIDFRFAAFKKGTWKSYDTLDGLGHNVVWSIYRDPDGVMWFGTDDGLSRYDGKGFVNFTTRDGLPSNSIYTIYGDSDGVMWLGTWGGGVSRYDRGMGDSPHFVNFDTEDGLADNIVVSIRRSSDGYLWFGTHSGVSRYDGKEFVTFTAEDGLAHNVMHTDAIHCDSDGVVWFGTQEGLSRYDGKKFTNFTTQDGLAHNWVHAVGRSADGALWVGTRGGLSRYDGRGMGDFPHFVNFTHEDGLPSGYAIAIHQAPDGVMWFGMAYGPSSLSRYDGKTFVNFAEEDGLPNSPVIVIYRDPDGTMWLAKQGDGVFRYTEEELVTFTMKDGLAGDTVYAIHRDIDGTMWIGTGGGVSRYDGKRFINFTAEDGLVSSIGSICRESDSIMWFGSTWQGVSRYDARGIGDSPHFVNFTTEDGLPRNKLNAIHRGPDGSMWFAAGIGKTGGLARYDGDRFVSLTSKDGLAHDWVLSIHTDPDGVMWIGTAGGLSRYDGREFINFTEKDGLANNFISAIHSDPDGILWLGTGGGVSRMGKIPHTPGRYDGRTMGDSPHFVNFTTEDGLAHDVIKAIYRAPDGTLWLGTEGGGVAMYDGIAWSSLDTRDRLAGNTVSAIDRDPDGSMWFGTNDGLTRYRRSPAAPQAKIVSITADQTYRDLSAIPAFAIGTRVTMEYDAVDFKTIPEKRQYRCRIYETSDMRSSSLKSQVSGLAYNPPTKETTFDWTPTKPGTYTFEVQGIDRDLNYSEPASLEIKILPPAFYTRAGFIMGTILAAFFIPTGVLGTILVRQKRKVFEPIPNPYIVGNPIRSREMFFGRESDFEFVRAKLAAGQAGLVIVFAGERRSGKTSILFQIHNGELGEQFVPVLMDMQAMTVDSEAEFFEKMASEINEALVRAGINPAPTEFREGNPTRIFERFIAQTMEALEGKALLLMLDEYELIEAKIDDGVLRPDVITFFASLLEAHPRLSFIFTGSRHLEQRNPAYWYILIGKSLYRRISFLSQRDALRLIMEPVEGRVIHPRGIPERIVRLTAGQPFYTQVVCQNLVDRLNEVQRNRVCQEDIDAVAQELADNPLPQMIYFWDGLEPEQQSALSLLGEVLEDSSRYASAQMLLNFAQEQNLGSAGALNLTPLPELEQILDGLFVSEVLERERAGEGKYEYRFRVDLFRLWVRQAHSVWQTV